ncbi:choice-of-anchor B family protein [Jejudonia soesokkakensis]|uniref:Choice-of-anchor B family protein n=1 Tax=Jejudonia soesokkakensis TaxID=1323432 RepID=A0ABW2MN70_9FLAO
MKKILLLIVISFAIISCGSDDSPSDTTDDVTDDGTGMNDDMDPAEIPRTAPCENGFAGPFQCNDYDLVYRFDLVTFGATAGNDSWGWTDSSTGKEYALMCVNNGVAFVDITADPPIYLGKLPTATFSSAWRDVKVYNNFAFIVSEASGHGMQVFDLTRLRNVSNPPSNFSADATYTGFGNAHNIVINESSAYAYAVGTQTFNGGPHFIDIQDPLNPVAAGGFAMDAYSHDAQVVTYNGPDTEHAGKEILIGSNEDQISIVDITDKANPIGLSTISYGQVGYTHQGWFTEDQTIFILGDEIDEQNFGFNTRTLMFDFSDLDNPSLIGEYSGPTPAIDHNGYVKGNSYFMANYTAGLRVLDATNAASGTLNEIGYFDTFPANNNAGFDGAWNVYPYFESGKILISDINTGLYIVKKR